MDYTKLTLKQVLDLLNEGKVTSEELTKQCIESINSQSDLNALISTTFDEALKKAKEVDQKRAKGEKVGELAGVPVIIKDNINMVGSYTTCGSKFLSNYKSVYDATVVERLKNADAVILGKANMDEFAMGSSNETSYFGVVKNPHNKECVPGGSSGGSGVVVASNMCYLALGSDTGGSIRLPASFCGIYGLKPTYGLVPRFGLVAFASSLDQVGPMARSSYDIALALNVLAGYDKKEMTSSKHEKEDYTKSFLGSVKGLKIGVDYSLFEMGTDEEVKQSILSVIKFYEQNGAIIVPVKVNNLDMALPVYYILASAEASSNLGRFDGIRYGVRSKNADNIGDVYLKSRTEGFGNEVKRRIMLGNFVLSSGYFDAYYKKAQRVQTLIKEEFSKVFESCDALIMPTSPTTAFKIGEKFDDPLKMYLGDIYTIPANIAGVPAMSVPCGKDSKGLPIGFQLFANKFDEKTLLNLANFYEINGGVN